MIYTKRSKNLFFRLSVIPEKQGQGLAKALIAELEQFAWAKGKTISECKVRMSGTEKY